MTSALEKLAGLAHWPRTAAAPALLSPAAVKMSTLPVVVDTAAWYEEHAQLCYELQLAAVRAGGLGKDAATEAAVDKAHTALLAHAAIIHGGSEPVLLAKDGLHAIPYEKLAEARAKVQVLTAALAQAREELAAAKAEGWRPEFDAMSPRQEELAIQFCQEIAGRRGESGSPPDPVRLLEMAQALYEAEQMERAP
jgi:hypothetical protein